MNQVTLIGRVGDIKAVGKIAVISLGLKERKGEQTITEWHRVKVLREKTAEAVARNVEKGMTIGISGKIRVEKYKPRGEEKERVQVVIYAHEVEILNWNKPGGRGEAR